MPSTELSSPLGPLQEARPGVGGGVPGAAPVNDHFLITIYYLISQSDSRDPQNPGAHHWPGLRVRDE